MRLTKSNSIVTILALVSAVLSAGAALAMTFFTLSPLLYFSAGGGNLSAYQVGFYDAEDGAELRLVNPTPLTLEAFVVVFDDDETPLDCDVLTLSPNDFEELDLGEFDDGLDEGVIKVVTFKPGAQFNTRTVQAGVVGWIRHENEDEDDSEKIALSDTQLAAVPVEVLTAQNYFELRLIEEFVSQNCAALD